MRSMALLFAALTLSACAKKEEPVAAAPKAAEPAPAPAKTAEKAPVIDPVLFTSGGTTVAADQVARVDAAANVLKTTDWTVLVLGLADAEGDAEANKVLSQQRAEAVAKLLREKAAGVPETRVVVHAIGERLATGASADERKVEFVFYHDEGLTMKEVVMKSGVLAEDFHRAGK